METLVEVSFHLSSDKTNMHEIERLIGIYPCRTRTEFPKGSIAVPFWCIERQVKCLDFETAFYVLFDEIAKANGDDPCKPKNPCGIDKRFPKNTQFKGLL